MRYAIGQTSTKQLRVLTVFDTANEADDYDKKDRCSDYANWVQALDQEDETVWLGVHQPLWVYQTDKNGAV